MDGVSGIGFKIIWWHWHEGFKQNQICHEVIIVETPIGARGLYTLSNFLMYVLNFSILKFLIDFYER